MKAWIRRTIIKSEGRYKMKHLKWSMLEIALEWRIEIREKMVKKTDILNYIDQFFLITIFFSIYSKFIS